MNRAAALLLPLLASGCVVVNPAYMLDEHTTGVAETGAQDPLTTDVTPTSDADGSTSTSTSTSTTSTSATVAGTTGDETTGGTTTMDTGTTGDLLDSGSSTSGTPPPGLPDCDPADPALLACYDFEPDPNDPTRLVDGSQYGNDGVSSNVGTIAGVEGQGVEILDTTTISVPDKGTLAAVDALTLSAWVQLAAQPLSGQRVGILDNDAQWGVFIHAVDGLACTVAGVKVSAAQPFPTGTWTHVGCVFDGQDLRLYIDGQTVAQTANGGSIGVHDSPLLLGCNSPGCDERMIAGRLDSVRIWAIARTDAEICAEADACR